MSIRIVQISDTHVLAGDDVTTGNAERVVEFVNDTLRPDLVVHTGDVVGLSPDDDGDRRAAVATLAGLRAPMLVVPGNHDIGVPSAAPWMGFGVTGNRIATHTRAFGEVPFLETCRDWGVIGLNSEVLGSGLPEDEQQWEWLERTLAAATAPWLVLFMHRPLWNHRPSREPDGNVVPAALRDRLLSLPGSERLRAVGNGHLHWYRSLRRPELLEVWGPATAFLGPTYEDTVAFSQCGVVEWRLDAGRVDAWFRAPATLDERELEDVPAITAGLERLERRRAARRTVRWNQRVRLVLADVDETIAGLYEPASDGMLSALSSYLRDGGKLFLITGGSLRRVTSGVTDGIDAALRGSVLVAPVSGAEVWGFTSRGTLRVRPFFSRYEQEFTAGMKRRWRAAVAQLITEYGLRAHAVRPPARFRLEVGHDPLDIMVDDRGPQITFEFVNGPDLRVPVRERAAELLRAARLPVTPHLASVFALNMTIEGVSKASAVAQVIGSSTILASVGLTRADIAAPHALEVWGDDFSAVNGGADLHMSRALAPPVRSIDFRGDDPAGLPADLNIVLWDGERRLQDGVLEYLTSRRGARGRRPARAG